MSVAINIKPSKTPARKLLNPNTYLVRGANVVVTILLVDLFAMAISDNVKAMYKKDRLPLIMMQYFNSSIKNLLFSFTSTKECLDVLEKFNLTIS
ncbi:hypothetical protein [Sulfolobus acidocaldarius]|uniref:Uncharacterized protein n=1 Tax=Sulfolobus acidocaldarius N8 TaxID=1028566 RepID=M1I364_9CREN|nr:hypothetical protein [Sulfolobus acidocaldarius]AGE70673.1 hypothetical protein SacN8_03500 [Sulfolobus acidocaldarius N8]